MAGDSSAASVGPADVAVLGAGIIGAAIARELAVRGHRVVLVDRGEPGSGSSGRCDGNVLVQTKHSADMVRLTMESITGFRRWVRDLGNDMRFEQPGSLVFYTEPSQLAARDERAAALASLGVSVEVLDEAGVREREPALDGPLVGGLDCHDDASVYPPSAVAALVRDLLARRGQLLTRTTATRLTVASDGSVTGVDTDRGHLSAPVVVNAMGVWSPRFEARAAPPLPIQPRQGVLLVTEEVPGLFRRAVTESAYMDLRIARAAELLEPPVFVAEPTYRGNVLLGSTRRFIGEDTTVDLALALEVAARAQHFSSALARVQVIRTFAGLRPWTPDNLPIIGAVPGAPGYLLATGHEGEGIGLAPVTAQLVAKIVDGEAPTALEAWALDAMRPDRFALTESHEVAR